MKHFFATKEDLGHLKANKQLVQNYVDEAELNMVLAQKFQNETLEYLIETDSFAQIDCENDTLHVRVWRGSDAALREAIRVGVRRGMNKLFVWDYCPQLGFVFDGRKWSKGIALKCVELGPKQFDRLLKIAENADCTCDCECVQVKRAKLVYDDKKGQVLSLIMGDRLAGFAVCSREQKVLTVYGFYIFPSYRRMNVATFFISEARRFHADKLRFIVCCECCCCEFYEKRGLQKIDFECEAELAKKMDLGCHCAFERFLVLPQETGVLRTQDLKTWAPQMGRFVMKCIVASGIEVRRHDTAEAFALYIEKLPFADVVVFEKKAVAFCAWHELAGEGDLKEYETSTLENRVYVAELFVHPGWQNLGLGHALLARLPRKLLQLHVENDNFSAQKFYESVGFRRTTMFHKNRHTEMVCEKLVPSTVQLKTALAFDSFLL